MSALATSVVVAALLGGFLSPCFLPAFFLGPVAPAAAACFLARAAATFFFAAAPPFFFAAAPRLFVAPPGAAFFFAAAAARRRLEGEESAFREGEDAVAPFCSAAFSAAAFLAG